MRNVYVTRQFRLCLTADDWSLYGDNQGRLTDERNAAALALNRDAEAALNSCASRSEAGRLIEAALQKYSSLGASDTEGYDVMYQLLDAAFPERNNVAYTLRCLNCQLTF
jgi:hypothetical protein